MLFCANTLRRGLFCPGEGAGGRGGKVECRRTEKKEKNKKAARYQINFMDTKRRGGERKPEKGETGGREGEKKRRKPGVQTGGNVKIHFVVRW